MIEWAPRDVVAHLIGWNVNTLEGRRQIRRGEAPFYLGDVENDFQHVTAASVRWYNSTDKDASSTSCEQQRLRSSAIWDKPN